MGNTTVVTADYGTIVTAIGAAKIANCILSGKRLNITHAAVGDGGGAYYKPTTEQTGLIRECWRGEIASYEINPENANMLDVKFIVPAEVGGFTVREAEVIDADGDVFAVCNTPDAQKVAVTDGVSFPLTVMMHIIVTDASAVEVTVNPSLDTVSQEELEEALKRHSTLVGSCINREVTIPAEDWQAFSSTEKGFEKYKYAINIAIEGCLEEHFPSVAISVPSEDAAAVAGISRTSDAFNGYVTLYARNIPTEDLTATISLRSENMAEAADVITGDVATDEEVEEKIEDVFSADGSSSVTSAAISSDEEVYASINQDIFGL